MNKEFPVIEIEASGNPGWFGGAWCLAWVYSTEGNFLLKGYIKECEEYIEEHGWKCWTIFNLYHTNSVPSYKKGRRTENYRTIIRTYKCDFDIAQPFLTDKKKKADDWKYRVYQKGNWKNGIKIKRLPKQFVNFNPPEFEGKIGSLSESNKLKELKDKLDR